MQVVVVAAAVKNIVQSADFNERDDCCMKSVCFPNTTALPFRQSQVNKRAMIPARSR